jgi:hypothetical protein
MTYPEEKGPEEVPVQFVFEANQDYENYKQGIASPLTLRLG